ncbi:MAG: hypothetical protein ACE5DQ_00860 [Candidatus Paceibacterota bacterium]
MNRRGIYIIIILLGLIVALSFYNQRQTTRSSAFEQTGQVKVYVDSNMCDKKQAWQELGYTEYPGKNPWRAMHSMDQLREVHLQRGNTETNFTVFRLENNGQEGRDDILTGTPKIPETVKMIHSCTGGKDIYVYKCLTSYCSSPLIGGGLKPDVTPSSLFFLIRKYHRSNAPQDASWSRNLGNYLITPWCDPKFFSCKEGGTNTY